VSARSFSTIDPESAERQFVVVDLKGAASLLVSRIISRSDLVLILMQERAVDAARVVGISREEEQVIRRSISCSVLFTRMSPAAAGDGLSELDCFGDRT
jgi:chromosome partitioning protein